MAPVRLAKRHDDHTVGIILQYLCGIVRMEVILTLIEELTHRKFEILKSAFL